MMRTRLLHALACAGGLLLCANAAQGQLHARQVAAGWLYACAVTASGGAKCWGSPFDGTLGDGSTLANLTRESRRPTPVDVVGLSNSVSQVATGFSHTCALMNYGRVKCWGTNGDHLGDGFTTRSPTPVDVVPTPDGATAIGVGWQHSCLLTGAGGVRCWGSNEYGQLGHGGSGPGDLPWPSLFVSGLQGGVTAIAVGPWESCALTNQGTVKCWGLMSSGNVREARTPRDVAGISNAVSIALGGGSFGVPGHGCAVLADNSAMCWGRNDHGQLGNGTRLGVTGPTNVVALGEGVVSMALGWDHSCALTVRGGVKCWGSNEFGQLGDGTTQDSFTPIDVPGLTSGVISIGAGLRSTCAATTSEGVKCWGSNSHGQVGDNSAVTMRNTATAVSAPAVPPAASYQGLWWSSPAGAESGWGVNLTHQGDTLFATWFTYSADGTNQWLVMADGVRTSNTTYTGTLYRPRGPFYANPSWDSSQVSVANAGTATFTFSDSGNGTFTYTLDGVTQTKPITRQVYAARVPQCTTGGTWGATPNYQGLWWAFPPGRESGWGLNLAHQSDTLFGTWFTYDATGKATWLVMPSLAKNGGPNRYSGFVYRTSGPPFNTASWNSSQVTVTQVGTAVVDFSDINYGTFAYDLGGGVVQVKNITRQLFSVPVTVCN